MAILTSIVMGGLELENTTTYAVGNETIYSLHNAVPRNARLVEMAARNPAYVGTTPQARQITLNLFMLNGSAEQRLSDYTAFLAALETPSGLVTLDWTEGASTFRYLVHVDSVEPSKWFTRASAALVAPNPFIEVL